MITRALGAAFALSAVFALSAAPAVAADLTVTGLSGQTLTLTPAQFAALPRQTATLQLEGGRTQRCEGVALTLILQRVGAPFGAALRGAELTNIVVVSALDGYRVALALAETDALVKTTPVIIADRCDGAPLKPNEGPYRLVVETDKRPARSARMVTAIAVRRVAP